MSRKNKGSNNDNGFEHWGGYMEAKYSKLDEQFVEVTCKNIKKQSDIFSGVSIFVNGYTNPSSTELKTLMAMHSGIYHHYYRPGVTDFVIASNLPDFKIKSLTTCKVVRPEWITNCISQNRLLDYSNYLLYTNENTTQPKLSFQNLGVAGISRSSKISPSTLHPECNFSEIDRKTYYDNTTIENKLASDVKSTETIIIKPHTDTSTKLIETIQRESSIDKAKTAVDPQFLIDFYNNSRLHHIATLGAGFKQHITELRRQSSSATVFIGREKLKAIFDTTLNVNCRDTEISSYDKVIMHIDMDCFFVSVGLRTRPELKGLPIAVAHAKTGKSFTPRPGMDRNAEVKLYNQRMKEKLLKINSDIVHKDISDNTLIELDGKSRLDGIDNYNSMSEIASCSYEARSKGIKNGMFLGAALKLCPDLKTIPYDFEAYKEVGYILYNTIAEYTLDIESVSCDEMFVDITQLIKLHDISPIHFAHHIRSEIKTRTACPCSTGFGSNKLQARLATRKAKPDGQYVLPQYETEIFMENVSISDIPGVGYSTALKLESMGCKTCGELQRLSISTLQKEFGMKYGENLYNHCRGIDNRPLIYEHIRKSVSAEINYGIRFTRQSEFHTFLQQLSKEVHSRLNEINAKGRCITLKLMARAEEAPKETAKYMGHGVCDSFSKSQTLRNPTNDLQVITNTVVMLAKALAIKPNELRGIGIQISRLEFPKSFINSSSKPMMNFFKSSNVKLDLPTIESNSDVSLVNNDVNNTDQEIKDQAINVNDSPTEVPFVNDTTNNKERKLSPIKKCLPQNRRTNKITKRKNINSLQKFLINAPASSKIYTKVDNTFKGDIDPEVLPFLPEEIQQEILKEYKLESNCVTFNKANELLDQVKINKQFLEELPLDIRKEIENQLPEQIKAYKCGQNDNLRTKTVDEPLFIQDTNIPPPSNTECIWTRDLLREWVKTETIPEQCDVEMLSQYINGLVINRKINDVFTLMNFLFRIINEQYLLSYPCLWHKAYCYIVDKIQCLMSKTYNNKLLLRRKFNCDKYH